MSASLKLVDAGLMTDPALTYVSSKPAAFVRLEPQSITGDQTPGSAMAVHDPLWMLLQQWQHGEFAGEDAGTPLGVTASWTTTPLDTFVPGGPGKSSPVPLTGDLPLNPMVEATHAPAPPRVRAEASHLLALAVLEAGVDIAASLATAYPFPAGPIASAPAALQVILRGSADAALVAAAVNNKSASWMNGATPAVQNATKTWMDWYTGGGASGFSGTESWVQPRLEYQFAVSGGGQTFAAPEHGGGIVDWWSMDAAPGGAAPLQPAASSSLNCMLQPLRYAGQPADRLWSFEDGQVNLGAMDVQANDPARLSLIEFGTIYGSDWFWIPVGIPAAGFTQVNNLTIFDTFGVSTIIPAFADPDFHLFQVSTEDATGATGAPKPGLLTVPTLPASLEGKPIEQVRFLRDDTANMCWAVEETVPDEWGRPRRRSDELPSVPPLPPSPAGTDLHYTLETDVPPHWIPLVPVPLRNAVGAYTGGFKLRKGTMTGNDDAKSATLTSAPGQGLDFFDEEIPRGGLVVCRTPVVARTASGQLRRWNAMRIQPAAGPAGSALAFDGTQPPQ